MNIIVRVKFDTFPDIAQAYLDYLAARERLIDAINSENLNVSELKEEAASGN